MIEFVTLPDGEVIRKDSVLSVGPLTYSERNNEDFSGYMFEIKRLDPEDNDSIILDFYKNKSLVLLNILRNEFIFGLGQQKNHLNDVHYGWIEANGS